ncbi:MAG: hypothetical protein K6F30_11440 [Lachnospiraceae bacterium]|nr:hypothetical protein [Lachnospiraceae bacterium]
MRVLFALYNLQEEEAKSVVDGLAEEGLSVEDYGIKHSKQGILAYLNEHPDTKTVLVSTSLEKQSPFTVAEFEKFKDNFEQVQFIPILADDAIGTDYVKGLYNLGIMDAFTSQDASVMRIAKLIRGGRSRRDAKVYYHLDETDGRENKADIARCVRYIEGSGTEEELVSNVNHIYSRVDEGEFTEVMRTLSSACIHRMKKEKELAFLFENTEHKEECTDEKVKRIADKFTIKSLAGKMPNFPNLNNLVNSSISLFGGKDDAEEAPKPQSMKDVDELKDVLTNVLIGFTGASKKIGVTHQAIMAAHYFARYGYDVAILDCSGNGKAFRAIHRFRDVEQHVDFFAFQGVDYYTEVHLEDLQELINSIKYNFIIIDYGAFSPRVRADIMRCKQKFAVCGSVAWELGQTQALYDDLKGMSFHFLVRGMSGYGSGTAERITQLLDGMFEPVEYVEDPFGGNCYKGLARYFAKYTGGEILPDIEKNEPVRKDKRKRSREFVGTAVYFVTSLKHGCGSTHMAATICNYLADEGKRVCMITDNADNEFKLCEGVGIALLGEEYEPLYAKYDFLVFDCGPFPELPEKDMKELKRANYKIIMSWSDEDYMKRLALFSKEIEGEEDRYIFAFNNVPDGKIRQVQEDMSGFTSCYLPVYSLERVPKSVDKVVRELFV